MSPNPQVSAAAASDAYSDRPGNISDNRPVDFDNQKYTVFGYANDPITGFHATAYQNAVPPHNVIIAYSGTDPDYKQHKLTMAQDIAVDATMVRDTINPQKHAADEFTAAMLKKAHDNGISKDHVTTAGHSLGGTLAEIEPAKYGLRGTTLNAYGAVGLTDGPPAPGCQLTNYVMAGDPVSAANAHIGTVVPLASPKDVTSLQAGRYLHAPAGSAPPNPLRAMRGGDHGGAHFTGEGGNVNVLAPKVIVDCQQRYKDRPVVFDHFRDVCYERTELTEVRQADGRNSNIPMARRPPHVPPPLAEYHAAHVDASIQNAA